ncbi:hypothetical protein ACFQJD_17490 [Haloplanus sp. GCM10025708]|uniref:DUF7350 domain-containing protein n=1 Tax=Haloplanus sp. GCM10025708 TaxID=3252679 RepID=UPI00360D6A8A
MRRTRPDASGERPPVIENRPNAVYVPSHVEAMKVSGVASAGAYRCALTYSFPHRFWTVSIDRTERVSIREDDAVHLMPVVWHAETGVVPVTTNPKIEISEGGETVTSLSPWPMLSQPMGYHFGDNVELPGDGTYDVTVRTGAISAATDALAADAATFEFEFDYARETVRDIEFTTYPDEQGSTGAVPPMEMETVPTSQVPKPDALPGRPLGAATSGDAVFVATAMEDATPFGGTAEETYLAVSARTPYNRFVLPMMSLSATLERDGETVFEGSLSTALHSELDYHYGASVPSVDAGDVVRLAVDVPPQVARHEGYETAFFDVPPVEIA